MFKIDDDMTINVTRGDCAVLPLEVEVDEQSNYVFQVGDIVRITVVEKKNYENVVLQKDFSIEEENEVVNIVLTDEDTKFGEIISKPTTYWYEVVLNPDTNPQTVIGYDDDGPKAFVIYPEGAEI